LQHAARKLFAITVQTMNKMLNTDKLIMIIGSPFVDTKPDISFETLEQLYKKAFDDRVGLLYLSIHRKEGWPNALEEKYQTLKDRRNKTLEVIKSLARSLNNFSVKDYTIFKSLKPYPATPNDTDVINFGDKKQFKAVIEHLYEEGYLFHEWAPMQTTLIHPKGMGKTGKGKKGGVYYIDMYSDISTDYFLYIDKRSLKPYVETRVIDGQKIQNICKEVELAIILFHNVFPERTFNLEHFYMPLYHFYEGDFDINVMIKFTEDQKLEYAISTNLTLVEHIHNKLFGFTPEPVIHLLNRWGRNSYELERFCKRREETPYMFSPKTFWKTFLLKIGDNAALRSLFIQGVHMMNPIFFLDVVNSLKNRFSDKGTYHLE